MRVYNNSAIQSVYPVYTQEFLDVLHHIAEDSLKVAKVGSERPHPVDQGTTVHDITRLVAKDITRLVAKGAHQSANGKGRTVLQSADGVDILGIVINPSDGAEASLRRQEGRQPRVRSRPSRSYPSACGRDFCTFSAWPLSFRLHDPQRILCFVYEIIVCLYLL